MPTHSQSAQLTASHTESLDREQASLQRALFSGSGALSVDGFCKYVGIGRTTANKLIKSGEIQTKLAGRRRLVPLDAITAWLKG